MLSINHCSPINYTADVKPKMLNQEKVPKRANILGSTVHSITQRLLKVQLTFFGLASALSEQQLVLFIRERLWKDSGHQRTEETQNIYNQSRLPFKKTLQLCNIALLPHGVGQRQHSQAEKVNRQQEVDVLLGKHLRGSQTQS